MLSVPLFMVGCRHGSGQCFLDAPPKIEAADNSFCVDANILAPHGKSLFLPAKFYYAIRSPVIGLLRGRSPAAVLLKVAKIGVASLDAVARRGLQSHVGQKVLKLSPARTNGNSPSSIDPPVRDIRICASSHHVRPAAELWRAFSSKCVAVLYMAAGTFMLWKDSRHSNLMADCLVAGESFNFHPSRFYSEGRVSQWRLA